MIPLAACVPRTGTYDTELLTRAERTEYRETSSYEEVVELSERLADLSDDMHLSTFGYTDEGRALPLLVVGAPAADPETVRSTGKLRVYLQGNIHAGEVCGKEALLMLLRRFATSDRPSWSRDLVLLVAPIYNADGNERVHLRNRPRQHGPVGGMGTRANAQGLDLNRDHTKLDTPEARSLAAFLSGYDPHVAVDLHTTNGTRHAYHLTYSPPLHPNTPSAIDSFLRDRLLPTVTQRMREDGGWETYHYGNVGRGGAGWYTFDHRPRFGNNYLGLRNRMGILSEAYAHSPFEERVEVTLRFVAEILRFAGENAPEIRSMVAELDSLSLFGRELAVRADFEGSSAEVDILLGEVAGERNPYTGAVMLRRLDRTQPTPMREYVSFRATETERVPAAYYLLPEANEAVARLAAHGATVEELAEDATIAGERFLVDSVALAERDFQGRRERTVYGRWVDATIQLPAGTARIATSQPLGRLIFTLLEPRSDDGFVSWGLLGESATEEGMPVFRSSE